MGYLASPLVSVHEMPGVPTSAPCDFDNPKCSQTLPNVRGGSGQNHPLVENYRIGENDMTTL